MSIEGKNRETDKPVDSQGPNNRRKPSMFEIMIADKQKSQIFGLNFLQDAKGEPTDVTGAYDPKQERWIMQGPEHGGSLSERSKTRSDATWDTTKVGTARDSVKVD